MPSISKIFARNPAIWLILPMAVQISTVIFQHHNKQSLNAFSFFLSSVLFGVIIILNFLNKEIEIIKSSTTKKNKATKIAITILGIILVIIALYFTAQTFITDPVSIKNSDVIPTIQELCQRFFDDKFVYEPIEKFGYHLPVTYLPMQWMPYLAAEYFKFDYRWIAIGIWGIAFIFSAVKSFKYNNAINHLFTLLLSILPYYFIAVYTQYPAHSILKNTVELMVSGYYILLILSLSGSNPVFRGLMVAICLMSRYSLVLWLPLAVVVLWLSEPRRNLIISAGTALVFILVIYIIPFLSKDWGAFYSGYKYYDNAAIGEWKHINPSNGLPYQLYGGYGFAYVIYSSFPKMELLEKIKLLQSIHFWSSIGSTIFMTLIYLKIRNNIHYRIFLFASFKIYFAIFVFFIQVPYQYLMLVDLYITISIFTVLMRYKFVVPE